MRFRWVFSGAHLNAEHRTGYLATFARSPALPSEPARLPFAFGAHRLQARMGVAAETGRPAAPGTRGCWSGVALRACWAAGTGEAGGIRVTVGTRGTAGTKMQKG